MGLVCDRRRRRQSELNDAVNPIRLVSETRAHEAQRYELIKPNLWLIE